MCLPFWVRPGPPLRLSDLRHAFVSCAFGDFLNAGFRGILSDILERVVLELLSTS